MLQLVKACSNDNFFLSFVEEGAVKVRVLEKMTGLWCASYVQKNKNDE